MYYLDFLYTYKIINMPIDCLLYIYISYIQVYIYTLPIDCLLIALDVNKFSSLGLGPWARAQILYG